MPARFRLQFNRRTFEYDIYNLIRSFFPFSEVTIWYEGDPEPEGSYDADFSVNYTDDSVSFSFGRRGERTENGEVSADQKLIRLASGDWFPNAPYISVISVTDWNDRVRTKNEVKSLVYQSLSSALGRTLPWGDLTGIRPTKIAMKLLEEGHTDGEISDELKQTYFVSGKKCRLALDTVKREKAILDRMHTERGYSLYVDVPFCPTICLYCSFGSHPLERFQDYVEPYFQALYRELRFISREMEGRPLDTVYIGGGTPTSVPAERLRELFGVLYDLFDMKDVAEFTVEAGRPDTITEDKLEALRDFHVTRISINPQTMNQKTLDLIGRRHTVQQTEDAFRMARSLGFDNINMDTIVGLPGEGAEEVAHTMEAIRRLNPDSLTVHSLALKRATRLNLFKDEYEPIAFDNSESIMDQTEASAAALSMTPYYLYRQKNMAGNFENVGYARAGKACIYNVLIMEERQTIMAAGSGASTKFVFDGGRRIERAENVKDLKNYIERVDEMCGRKAEGIRKYLS